MYFPSLNFMGFQLRDVQVELHGTLLDLHGAQVERYVPLGRNLKEPGAGTQLELHTCKLCRRSEACKPRHRMRMWMWMRSSSGTLVILGGGGASLWRGFMFRAS